MSRGRSVASPSVQRGHAGTAVRGGDARDTMLAWERFLTGDPMAAAPLGNFVVASWQRSLALGVDPTGRSAPIAADNDDFERLRIRSQELLDAAAPVFAEAAEFFAGSRTIMLLTDADGVVLESTGDTTTLDAGAGINLRRGGDWREAVVGTNGIGTAIATRRPAQVHAAEHFCEGIKAWTCAAAPIMEPGTDQLLGIVDISGPPSTYQRGNLAFAVATARQIESILAERAAQERNHLLVNCLSRLSAADTAGLIAIDRAGRLVHATGRVLAPVRVGERVPGLARDVAIEDWAGRLPQGWRPEWFSPVAFDGRAIGAMLVVPNRGRAAAGRGDRAVASEADPERCAFDHIIGHSATMKALLNRANLLAHRRVPVLIEGETGVGKELLARAIHGDGQDGRPFIAFNCGAVSRELIAGELFGHVRGAFTGATAEGRAGRFELADGGTLCLDEIGELPLDLQPVLLRALEEGVVYRLGDTQPRRVEVRLISITNRNLREEVEAGRFRRDLFYRIGVTTLTVPPLRERVEDIDLLVEHFNHRLAARHHVPIRQFAPSVMATLRGLPWRGNVRELRNVIENLLLSDDDELVTLDDLPAGLLGIAAAPAQPPPSDPVPMNLEDAERTLVLRALRDARGNVAGAARLLGISRSTIYRMMIRFGLTPRDTETA